MKIENNVDALTRVIEDVSHRNSKLVLIVGSSESAKSNLLRDIAAARALTVMRLSSELARKLIDVPTARRPMAVKPLLVNEVTKFSSDSVVLIDSIELLFDKALRVDPFLLLKSVSALTRVVVAWPGQLVDGRLTYAELGHPEYSQNPLDGAVSFTV